MIKRTASFFAALGGADISKEVIANNLQLGNAGYYKENNLNIVCEKRNSRDSLQQQLFIFGSTPPPVEEIVAPEQLSLLKGNFAAMYIDGTAKKIFLYISITGNIPAYIIQQDDQIFITSQLKAFRHTELFTRQLIPLDQYAYSYTDKTPQDFSLMQNCRRAIPGVLYTFSFSGKPQLSGHRVLQQHSPARINISRDAAKEKIYDLLADVIHCASDEAVAVPLSGGVDSGTIAGLLSRKSSSLYTFSIGTEFGNEFENARLSADFCKSSHRELFMNDDDFREGLVYSVYHNELCDPLYAEGFSAFYHLFKHASEISKKFFTGYGADLVLGNIFHIEAAQLQDSNASWCRRTSWTGELSPYLAGAFDSEMHFPFWSEELIQFCLSLPPEFLWDKNRDKVIFRELSEEKKLTHPSIAQNKKTALTHGTSLDKVFTKILKEENNSGYIAKSHFLYYLFESLFVLDKNPEEIDFDSLLRKIKTT